MVQGKTHGIFCVSMVHECSIVEASSSAMFRIQSPSTALWGPGARLLLQAAVWRMDSDGMPGAVGAVGALNFACQPGLAQGAKGVWDDGDLDGFGAKTLEI